MHAFLVDWFSTYGHAIEEETKSTIIEYIEHTMTQKITWNGHMFFFEKVSYCHTLASHALECCIMFTLSSET